MDSNDNNNPPAELGGEFPAYGARIKAFFANFAHAGLQCMVFQDGAVDPRKIKTTMERRKQSLTISKATLAEPSIAVCRDPPFGFMQVFNAVISSLDHVRVVDCPFEADSQLANFSNSNQVPVMSNDSDFLVYPTSFGLLLFEELYFERSETEDEYPLRLCIRYLTRESVATQLGLKPLQLIPLAALLGHDYSLGHTYVTGKHRIRTAATMIRNKSLPRGSDFQQDLSITKYKYENMSVTPTDDDDDDDAAVEDTLLVRNMVSTHQLWWPFGAFYCDTETSFNGMSTIDVFAPLITMILLHLDVSQPIELRLPVKDHINTGTWTRDELLTTPESPLANIHLLSRESCPCKSSALYLQWRLGLPQWELVWLLQMSGVETVTGTPTTTVLPPLPYRIRCLTLVTLWKVASWLISSVHPVTHSRFVTILQGFSGQYAVNEYEKARM